jgi:proteasome accessory factor B
MKIGTYHNGPGNRASQATLDLLRLGGSNPAYANPARFARTNKSAAVMRAAHPGPGHMASVRLNRVPWERMLKMYEWLQDGEYPNCVTMAARLEVSVRTVKRDIEFLRDRLRLPIAYDRQKHGFYYSGPVDHFGAPALSEAEVFGLWIMHRAAAKYLGESVVQPFESVFSKLTGGIGEGEPGSFDRLEKTFSFRPFAPETTDLPGFREVMSALVENRRLKFKYKNLGTRTARSRLVDPYHLACIDNHWYLFAYDLHRRALRTFALARLRNPELTRHRFTPPQDFDLDEYLRGSFTVLRGGGDYEVTIQFDAWATDLLRGRQWHVTQRFVEVPGNGSQLQLRLNSLDEVERWILSWGVHATVLRPLALQARLSQTLSELTARYPGESSTGLDSFAS